MYHAVSRQDQQARTVHVHEGHHHEVIGRKLRVIAARPPFVPVSQSSFIPVVPICNYEFLIAHFFAHCLNRP